MKKSISEQAKRIRSFAKKQEVAKAPPKEESDKTPGRGRSSINSIPMPTLQDVYTTTLIKAEAELEASVKKEEPKKEANLNDELCNAFRFVVNYGVFEPNFEWLPHEVTSLILKFFLKLELLNDFLRLSLSSLNLVFCFYFSIFKIKQHSISSLMFIYNYSNFSCSFTFFNI